MSVIVRKHPRGGWDVDVRILLATGKRHRERRKLNASFSKTTAREWGERRERELLRDGPSVPEQAPAPEPTPMFTKEVPTLTEFAPRFIDRYARANRQAEWRGSEADGPHDPPAASHRESEARCDQQ